MRILFVSNGNFKHNGQRSHCFESRIRNGFIRNGHHVYFLSDRDTLKEGGVWGRLFGKKRLSDIFLSLCKNFSPDMIMLGQADLISLEMLSEAKKILPKVKIAAYCIDIVFYDHIENTITSKLPYLDAVFCTTAGPAIEKRFKKNDTKIAYIPNPCDTSIDYIRAEQKTNQPFDVFWAMRGMRDSYPNDPRYYIPRNLDQDPDIDIDYYGFDNKPILMGRNYYEAISHCKGGLNISVSRLNEKPQDKDENIYLYSSDRIGHYFGCGLLVYILKGFCLEELLQEDKYAVYFDNIDDLKEKIKFYKKHDHKRIEIAKNGAEYYRTHFNEKKVTQYIEEITFFEHPKSDFKWKTKIYS